MSTSATKKLVKGSQCPKCNKGIMKLGIALGNTLVMGIPDFPGNTINSRGQTVHFGGPGVKLTCLKCDACGHSVVKVRGIK